MGFPQVDRLVHAQSSQLTPHTSFAIFLCLQCAGTHRGFGVHVRCVGPNPSYYLIVWTFITHTSFVRSVSMDTWQEDQVKRMTVGHTQHIL